MSEQYLPRTWVDVVLVGVREFRGVAHGVSYQILSEGDEPSLTYGWQSSTCLDQYSDLDLVGRVAIRLFPTGFGLFLAGVALQLPLTRPTGLILLLSLYLGVLWLVFTVYDPLMGLYHYLGNWGGR